ncbi:hypothetical protein D5S17_09035 [Pseudonocardiaceae bacterium YIM PH 21723]|nr:hypothetical protein D5S17_09035 [Pseudonocardiaceae bacterium YIM PH 21723]
MVMDDLSRPAGNGRIQLIGAAVALVAVAGLTVYAVKSKSDPASPVQAVSSATAPVGAPAPVPKADELQFERQTGPNRTVVKDQQGAVVATLTDGARTATVRGPLRTFREQKFTAHYVDSSTWVRLLPQAWRAGQEQTDSFRQWLTKALSDTSPDALAVAFEYADGAPAEKDTQGVRFRGDAAYGPVSSGAQGRLENNDFIDYLGIDFTYPDIGRKTTRADRFGAADCSGYLRLVYGYRLGFPLLGGNDAGPGLPRRAFAMATVGPGAVISSSSAGRPSSLGALLPGDLLFFEIDPNSDGLDHSAIYLGTDEQGKHRFISSRIRANGPTMSDVGGASLIGDTGFYSDGLRVIKRI